MGRWSGPLEQREPVRTVVVDLVGGGEDEGGGGRVAAGGLPEVERAQRVDGEISVRLAGGPVVGRLRGGMDDQFDAVGLRGKQPVDRIGIPDVQLQHAQVRILGQQRVGHRPG